MSGRGAHSSVKFLHVRGAWFGYSSTVKSPIVVLNRTSSMARASTSPNYDGASYSKLSRVCGSFVAPEPARVVGDRGCSGRNMAVRSLVHA